MNSMERFGALMAGRCPDRVPLIVNLIDQGAEILGMMPRDYFGDPDKVAEGQLALSARFGHDVLWSCCYVARDAEILGSKRTIFAPDGPPNVGHLIINSPDDIRGLTIPQDLAAVPELVGEAQTVARLKAADQGRHPVLSLALGSFSLPIILMGVDGWLDLLLTGSEALCRELLEKCSEFCERKVEALRAMGVDLIAYVNPAASAAFLTVPQFRELALEWIQRDVARIGTDGLVYYNGGGRIGPMLPDLLEATSFGAYYINPHDDPHEARAVIGDRALCVAAINDIKLMSWTDDEIDREVARLMAAKGEGGFLFGTLVMPRAIPTRAIDALMRSARRHGAYARERS